MSSIPIPQSYLNIPPKGGLALNGRGDKAWQKQKIEEAAVDFENQFLSLMIENMFTGLEADGMFGGGHSETIYRSFMADEYARSISSNGGIGIADAVRDQLLKLQEIEDGGEG